MFAIPEYIMKSPVFTGQPRNTRENYGELEPGRENLN